MRFEGRVRDIAFRGKSGVVTESCARLSSGIFRSNLANVGGGVISYVETMSSWTND